MRFLLTRRPLSHGDASKDTVQLLLVLRPFPAHHGHTHSPDAPAQQRYPSQLNFGKPAAASKHACSDRQRLDHIKVRPAHMVGDDDGRLPLWQDITRHRDLPPVEDLEDALDPAPIGEGHKGRGVVDPIRKKVTDWQEDGEDQVHDDQVEGPWYDKQQTPQVRQPISSSHDGIFPA